jgi:large subunit ribosomal protein L6
MSRIGKLPISLPAKVTIQQKDRTLFVEGPKGKLSFDLPRHTDLVLESGQARVTRQGDHREAKAMHGLARSIIFNMVHGVSEGFVKRLEIHGVGFKAAVDNNVITLNLGYAHEIKYRFPESVKVTVADNTKILVEGPDKQQVGEVAAEIRSFYPPEPYKGKGVRYAGEQILRKEGKTVQ